MSIFHLLIQAISASQLFQATGDVEAVREMILGDK